jgi:glucose-6-phosphate-specific signal transduction histidine kinase
MWPMFDSLNAQIKISSGMLTPFQSQDTQKASMPLVLSVFVAQMLVWYFGFFHWSLLTGLVFFVYWWRPNREWPLWTILSLLATVLMGVLIRWQTYGISQAFNILSPGIAEFIIGTFVWPFPIMLGAWFLKEKPLHFNGPVTIKSMSMLHIAALLTTFFLTLKDLAYVFTEGMIGDVRGAVIMDMMPIAYPESLPLLFKFTLSHFMGGFLGIMLVVPMMQWLFVPANRIGSKRIIRSAMIYLYLLPLLLYLSGALLSTTSFGLSELLKILLLAAVVVFSFFHGWRGAALSVLVVSSLIALDDHLHGGSADIIEMQLYVAVMGAMALLFGASVDELKKSQITLQTDKGQLQSALDSLADSTRRGMQSEEYERKRIARELHDDMGQILTAMQTQISMAQLENSEQERRSNTKSLERLAQNMAVSLKSVVNALSPDELDQLGLYSAITYGSPAQQCEMSGINYQVDLQGNSMLLEELDTVTRLAAYRIVQESITNAVKYASCNNIQVRLRIGMREEKIYLVLCIVDDGIGLKSLGQIKHGFYSIRDRAIALNGVLHVQNLPGVRVHVLLRQ